MCRIIVNAPNVLSALRPIVVNDTQHHDALRTPRFSLTALLTVVVFVGLILGWWADRTRLQRELTQLRRELAHSTDIARFAKQKLFEQLQEAGIGTSASQFPQLQMFADDTFDETETELSYLWRNLPRQHQGKTCVGYYFETAVVHEGNAGFFVLTVNGEIVAVKLNSLTW
jgi:hypothetical protein